MKFAKYPQMKESGIEWLGEIPSHWETRPLGMMVDVIGGATPSKDKPIFWDGMIPWVSPKDMKRAVLTDSEDHVSEAAVRETSLSVVDPPAVLLVVRGMILAHTVPIALSKAPVTINQDMKALLPHVELEAPYLAYLLRASNPAFLALVEEAGHGTKCLRTDLWRKVGILCPPLAEQRSITSLLNRKTAAIDNLIRKKERLIELLQEKRQALISEAVTKGLDPTVPMKDSGIEWIGNIPIHWKVPPIKYIARLESGHTPNKSVSDYWQDSNNIPWVSLNDTKHLAEHDYISDTALQINELGLENSSARLLPARVVVFTRDATIGKAAITTRPMAVSQHIIAWVCGSDITPEFLLRVFYAMEDELVRLTMGATLRTIGMPDVKKLVTPVPPLEEQNRIVAHVASQCAKLDRVRLLLDEQLTKLREYRQALISAAVTGKIDVRAEAAAARS